MPDRSAAQPPHPVAAEPDASGSVDTSGSAVSGSAERDVFVDFLRAMSLLVVIVWHWVFTIILWEDDGPHATNPLGFTNGLWLVTWLLQVMPLFFYVGGYGHLQSWDRARQQGHSVWYLVRRRIVRLAAPSAALLVTWVLIGAGLAWAFDWPWIGRAVRLVVSPLWFIAIYLILVMLLPVALWLHRRFDTIALVWMAGLAALVDVARFKYDYSWIGWLNMVLVWGVCHQLGFFYKRIVDLHRRADWTLLFAGLFGLGGLVFSDLYPGSMVGVPGDRLSNMAPPTMCIVALVAFQAGTAEILRPWLTERLQRPRWATLNDVLNRFSMPLFLFHTTGMAIAQAVGAWLFDNPSPDVSVDGRWWLLRPLAFVGPLICTIPVIMLFGRRWVRR